MRCKKCGKLIGEDRLYCEYCGAEVQVVPEYNKIEEELNESIRFLKEGANEESVQANHVTSNESKNNSSSRKSNLQDELESEKRRIIQELDYERQQNKRVKNEEEPDPVNQKQNRPPREGETVFKEENKKNVESEDANSEEEWQEFRLDRKTDSPKQKQLKMMASIIGLALFILIAIIGIVSFFVIKGRNHSFTTQYDAGATYWKAGNYDKAIVSYGKAIQGAKTKKEKLSANKELAKLYIEYGDRNNAIYYLEDAIDSDSTDTESIKLLIGLYEEKNDSDAIRKLAEKASNKDTVSLFEKYLLNQPIFNYKSGTYNELLTVDITSADGESIYYTLDDTPASAQSTLYAGPISVGEGTTIVHAITINSKGYISEEVVVTYKVNLEVPPNPIITPDSGKYTEACKISINNIPTNCKVFYTMDGSVPTDKSAEYTGPLDMLLGNYVVSAISINQYTGVKSEVVSKVFQLDIAGKIAWSESSAKVMNILKASGKVTDNNGSMPDGGVCVPVVQTTNQIGKTKYYIVKCYRKKGETMSDLNWYYAVNVNTGDVYTAIPNGAYQYNLNP